MRIASTRPSTSCSSRPRRSPSSRRSSPTGDRGAKTTRRCMSAHCLTLDHAGDDPPEEQGWQFETDRGRFIGRGRTLARPMGAVQELGNSQGFVLDPILSLRPESHPGTGPAPPGFPGARRRGEPRAGPAADGQIQRSPCDRSGHGFRLASRPSRSCRCCTSSLTKRAGSSNWPVTCCSPIPSCAPPPDVWKTTARVRPACGPTASRATCRSP